MLPASKKQIVKAIENEINRYIGHDSYTVFVDETGDELDLYIDGNGIGIIEDDEGEVIMRVQFKAVLLPLKESD